MVCAAGRRGQKKGKREQGTGKTEGVMGGKRNGQTNPPSAQEQGRDNETSKRKKGIGKRERGTRTCDESNIQSPNQERRGEQRSTNHESRTTDHACLPRLLASADSGVYHVRQVGKFVCRFLKEVAR